MKKIISLILIIAFSYFIYMHRENLVKFYNYYFVPIEDKITKLEKNSYYRDYNFKYVQNTDNFIPKQKSDIINIYYTIVNSGMNDFTFYCPREYKSCLDDLVDISKDQSIIENLDNFVHPYNSVKQISTDSDSTGRVTIHITRVYSNEDIIILNYKIDEIIKNNILETDTNRQKIKKIHDYIIKNTSYDKDRSDKKIINYKSENAYGVLIENYGLCGGYTDAMMLFLERFNIPSIKISTENHIWNYVKLNDEWLHLDVTWDGPTTKDGQNILDDSYFLITESELKNIEKEEHNYDRSIYQQS